MAEKNPFDEDSELYQQSASRFEESLQRDINHICAKLQEMSGLCEQGLTNALQALIHRDRKLAYTVILRDRYIDELDTELDRLCLEFFIRQIPVAGHLRFVFATIKIVSDLERVGDYAESVARQVLQLIGLEPPIANEQFIADLQEIASLSIPMLHDAVQAFIRRDAQTAGKIMDIEAKADELRSAINGKLTRLRHENQIPLEALSPLLTIARRYERVTDQAKNICEEVIYVNTGEVVKHKGAEIFRILFVDQDNSLCSQMAEAIGYSFKFPGFAFASAGYKSAGIIPPALVEFMAGKGMDISQVKTKTLAQITEIEFVQIIVALTPKAKDFKPLGANKATVLEWAIQNQCKAISGAAEVPIDLEKAFGYLNSHIHDLLHAIIGENEDRKNDQVAI